MNVLEFVVRQRWLFAIFLLPISFFYLMVPEVKICSLDGLGSDQAQRESAQSPETSKFLSCDEN